MLEPEQRFLIYQATTTPVLSELAILPQAGQVENMVPVLLLITAQAIFKLRTLLIFQQQKYLPPFGLKVVTLEMASFLTKRVLMSG